MDELIPKLNESLIMDTSNILGDYLEIGIDSIINDDIIKEIPFVKTFIGALNIYKSIRDRNSMKNIVIFLKELNSGNINKEKLYEYQEMLKNNPKKAEKELGRVLIILDQTIDNIKSSFLGKLFRAYVNQNIDWKLFVEFSEITNKLYINDIDVLKMIYSNIFSDTSNRNDLYRIERLNSTGLIGLSPKMIQISNLNSRQDSYITLNKIGKIYTSIIFN